MRPIAVVFLSLLLHLSTFGDSGKSDTSTALTIRALYKQIEALEKRVEELERYIQTHPVNLQSEATEPVISAKPVAKGGDPTDERNWRKLKRGMSEEQVKEILGEPNYIKVSGIRTSWSYKVRKPEHNFEWEIEFFTGANIVPIGLNSWEYPFD